MLAAVIATLEWLECNHGQFVASILTYNGESVGLAWSAFTMWMLDKELYFLGIVLLYYKAELSSSRNRLCFNMADVTMVAANM